MKSLEYVKNNIGLFEEDTIFDARFTKRFLDYIPVEEWQKFGFQYTGTEDDKPTPKEWTKENILEQLKKDVDFAIEKAVNHSGISSSLMVDVVKAWCKVLENGLDKIEYEDCWYGHKLYQAVDEMYHFGLVNSDTFNDTFFKEW